MRDYLDAGRVIGIHGFRGTLKVENRCDTPKTLASLKTLYLNGDTDRPVAHRVLKASVSAKAVLLTLEGIDSEEKANALRGALLYARRSDIPLREGSVFLADLPGMAVIDEKSGAVLGHVTDVIEGVASRLYEIKTPRGKVLMPEVKQFISRIVPSEGVYVTPIPGLFDDEGDEIRQGEDKT